MSASRGIPSSFQPVPVRAADRVPRQLHSGEQPHPWARVVPPQTGLPPQDLTVVEVGGELDVETAPLLREQLRSRLAGPASTIVVDLSAVRFLGVAALKLLLDARYRAEAMGKSFRLAGCPRCVARTLAVAESLGHRRFITQRTVAEAITDADPTTRTADAG